MDTDMLSGAGSDDFELDITVVDECDDWTLFEGEEDMSNPRRAKTENRAEPMSRQVSVNGRAWRNVVYQSDGESSTAESNWTSRAVVDEDESLMSLDQVIRKRQIAKPPPPSYALAKQAYEARSTTSSHDGSTLGDASSSRSQKIEGLMEMTFLQPRPIIQGRGSLSLASRVASHKKWSAEQVFIEDVRYTPTSVLRFLVNEGELIALDVYENPFRGSHRWRACYYTGRETDFVQGVGAGPRKALAKEAAAMDFLNNLRVLRPDASVPAYEIPKGCLINPRVLEAVEKLCASKCLGPVKYDEGLKGTKGGEKYVFTIIIQGLAYTEASYDVRHARVQAAKKAYDAIMDGICEYPYDEFHLGKSCGSDRSYSMVESEELHVCHSNKTFTEIQRLKFHSLKRKRAETVTFPRKKPRNVDEPRIPEYLRNIREYGRAKMSSARGSVTSLRNRDIRQL